MPCLRVGKPLRWGNPLPTPGRTPVGAGEAEPWPGAGRREVERESGAWCRSSVLPADCCSRLESLEWEEGGGYCRRDLLAVLWLWCWGWGGCSSGMDTQLVIYTTRKWINPILCTTHAQIHINTHTCMNTHKCMHTHTLLCACESTQTHTNTLTHMHMCTQRPTHIYVFNRLSALTHTLTHTHTHSHTASLKIMTFTFLEKFSQDSINIHCHLTTITVIIITNTASAIM